MIKIIQKILVRQKSQNGWPASSNRNFIGVKNYMVPGTKRYFAVATEAAPLLIAFAADFHRLVQPIDIGNWDDWGFHFALIPGSKDLSNHCSGTAIDINATKHNWGSTGTFSIQQVIIIHSLVNKYGLRWGGDYRFGKKDEMHFEIIVSPIKAKFLIAKLKLSMPKVYK